VRAHVGCLYIFKPRADTGDPVDGVAEVVDTQGIKTSFPRTWPL
jgi:hypothetical protein